MKSDVIVLALLAAWACSESSNPASPSASTAADAECPGSAGETYLPPGPDAGECRSGDTRCQGPTGYQQCQPDEVFSPPQSCASYGTANHCLAIDAVYAACVEPACWYWSVAGMLADSSRVGVCTPDGGFRACSDGGTLAKSSECAGACVTVAEINGTKIGFCRAECEDGAEECLSGPLYRACNAGRWERVAKRCDDGSACQPFADSTLPRIRCGACTPGASRCVADGNAIEVCNEDGQFELSMECARGVCQSKGIQAYCAPQCADDASDCSFDGALGVRRCIEPGQWSAEEPCELYSSCRQSGGIALGCVECVGPSAPGGNAWGVADSRCNGDELEQCGQDNRWTAAEPCASDETCRQLSDGPSSLAYCAP